MVAATIRCIIYAMHITDHVDEDGGGGGGGCGGGGETCRLWLRRRVEWRARWRSRSTAEHKIFDSRAAGGVPSPLEGFATLLSGSAQFSKWPTPHVRGT